MTKQKTKIKPFDASVFLTSEEDIEEYLRQAVEANDPELLVSALGDIAKARGMSEIAQKTGLTREGLYKSLSGSSKPRLETIQKVMGALGYGFTIKAV